MIGDLTGCGCRTGDCTVMPPEFVRVRYYFGQRLGVMELADEAAYHAGKHAFHNARLHGAGVLCGLRAERFVFTAGAPTTVLRVIRGAAIDVCGREVVVGIDQCIDVGAWFARHKTEPPMNTWAPNSTNTLWVGIRYRECPTDPSPAPRDPCGCDNGGCEYGRVHEGFELALLSDVDKPQAPPLFPGAAALEGAIEAQSDTLDPTINQLVAGDCPDPTTTDGWLCLASFTVTLDATPTPIDISDPDNTIGDRRSLLSTSVLQAIVTGLVSASSGTGALSAGPELGAIAFTATGPNSGTLSVPVALAQSGAPPTDTPIVTATFNPAIVKLYQFDPVAGWNDVTPPAANITYQAAPSQFAIVVPAGLTAGPAFRLSIAQQFPTPVADQQARALRPLSYARLFTFQVVAGNLQLVSA